MRHRILPLCLALWLTATLTGCGGGSGGAVPTGPGPTTPPTAAPTPVGTILAKVADTSGVPIAGAWVELAASGNDMRGAETNAAGEVRFLNVPAGRATLSAGPWGYYQGTQGVNVVAQSEVSATLALEPRDPTTAVVLGSRVVSKGADGKTLEFEVDVAVLDPSGQPLTNLSDAAFALQRTDCGWGACVAGPDGWLDAWYDPVTEQPQSFGLQPARARSPVAAGLLIDQGAQAKPYEPRRSAALAEFLAALGGNDSALLAEFVGNGSNARFTPSGGFVADGRSLLPLANGLPDRLDNEDSDPVAGTQSMLNYLAQQSSTAPKALVALTSGNLGCNDGGEYSCRALVEQSRAAGIPITTISLSRDSAADLSQRTGGAAFWINYPSQYRTAMRGLLTVLGGETPFYRMRFAVTVGSDSGVDVLAAGNTLYAYLAIRTRDEDAQFLTMVVPL